MLSCITCSSSCMVSSHAQREADISHWGGVSCSLTWAPPPQLAATSRRRRPSVCVLWGRTVGGLGVSKRERREEGGSRGQILPDLLSLSVCPQLRAGTARSALPVDSQFFIRVAGVGTSTAERRAWRQAAPTQAYLSGNHLNPARDQDSRSSLTSRSAPRPWSRSQQGVPPTRGRTCGGRAT
jgi:hypothetical protein